MQHVNSQEFHKYFACDFLHISLHSPLHPLPHITDKENIFLNWKISTVNTQVQCAPDVNPPWVADIAIQNFVEKPQTPEP